MRRLVFVHIPKTGGSAVREALRRAAPAAEHVWDYGRDKGTTSDLVKQLKYAPGGSVDALGRRLAAIPDLVFCGHIRAADFAGALGVGAFFTVLRDPVERVISHYHHNLRNSRFSGSLADFAAAPRHRNVQARLVGGTSVRDWLFVARQHRLAADLAELSDLIGRRIELEVVNVTPPQLKRTVSAADRDLIRQLNALDVELFEGVSELAAIRAG
jgi:hypothetical protein